MDMSIADIANGQSSFPSPPPLFSFRSHRFIVCLLLLLANYFIFANSLGMSTAVVCMVNSTLTVDKFEGKLNEQSCAVRHNDTTEQKFAMPGTLDWSSSQQSLLISARFYGSCLTVALSGIVADKLGPDKVLTTVLILSAALTLIISLLSYTNYHMLLISRFVMGIFESFHQPSVSCLASRWFPLEEKALAASIFTSGYQFAGGLSSLFASSLCRSSFFGGWPSIFYLFGGTTCIFTVFWVIFGMGTPEKNRWVKERERKLLCERTKLLCERTNSEAPTEKTLLSRILLSSPIHSIFICNFANSYSTALMQSFLPLFLRELGLPIETIGWYTLMPFFAQIAGKAVIGSLVSFCSGRNIISLTAATKMSQSLASFGAPITLILLCILPSCSNPHSSFTILVIYGLVLAGSCSGYYTSWLSMPPEIIGAITSCSAIAGVAAAVASTTVVNALTANESPYKWNLIFASAAVVHSIAGLHFLIFGKAGLQST